MMQKKDILDIIKVGLILFVITSISAGILATINNFTAPVIATNSEKKRSEAMSKVLKDVVVFDEIDYQSDSTVKSVYKGDDKGYVVLCEPNGYGGAISLVVGIDNNGVVTGIDITSQSETAGLGANCTKDEFKNQFIGKSEQITVVKNGADETQIDAISSATITSKAVTKGVNDALLAVNSIKGEGDISE